jgi:hypothetical protein
LKKRNAGKFWRIPVVREETIEASARKDKQVSVALSVFSAVNNCCRMYNEGKTRLVIPFLPNPPPGRTSAFPAGFRRYDVLMLCSINKLFYLKKMQAHARSSSD